MRTLTSFCIFTFLFACASPKIVPITYQDWDTNHDAIINRSEFVNGYEQADYFEKWSSGSSATYGEFFEGIFKSLDANKDLKIVHQEFDGRVNSFYFNMFHGTFTGWDNDSSGSIDKQEFMGHVASTNLATLWDTTGDKNINDRELASGMFYLCDINNNHQIDELEFNLWKVNQ